MEVVFVNTVLNMVIIALVARDVLNNRIILLRLKAVTEEGYVTVEMGII